MGQEGKKWGQCLQNMFLRSEYKEDQSKEIVAGRELGDKRGSLVFFMMGVTKAYQFTGRNDQLSATERSIVYERKGNNARKVLNNGRGDGIKNP